MVHKKHIYMMDTLFIVGTVLVLAGLIFFAKPTLNSPANGLKTTGAVLFSFSNGNNILIDDNSDFTSPQIYNVKDNLLIQLESGIYYWKVSGALDSEVRQLTITSSVDLVVKKTFDGYELVNGGNSKLAVDVYKNGSFTGRVILDVDKSDKSSGDNFLGREDA